MQEWGDALYPSRFANPLDHVPPDDHSSFPPVSLSTTNNIRVGTQEYVMLIEKTIKLGTGLRTAGDFHRAFKQAGMEIGELEYNIFRQAAFTTSDTEVDVDLVVTSVADLGFPDGCDRRAIQARALQRGLQLCSAEVGPQLRLQYLDQPDGEQIIIGMNAIYALNRHYNFFALTNEDGRLRLESYSWPDSHWTARHRFVFVRPQHAI